MVPINKERAEPIRACFCRECGRVAPSWFHSDFIMGHDGFVCKWCAFPDLAGPPPEDECLPPA